MDFPFLLKYRILEDTITEKNATKIGKQKHMFFPAPEKDIEAFINAFDPYPDELVDLYKQIGLGFMYRHKGDLNCLLDPISVVNINYQKGYNKDDVKITEALKHYDIEKYILFFKSDNDDYLAISRLADNNKNAIYYRGKKVDNSLYAFLYSYYRYEHYLEDIIEGVHEKELKEKQNDNSNIAQKQTKKHRIGGHEIIDPF